MKILFGIQGTGNGHLSRAKEVVPHLLQYGEVDLFVSGTEAEVRLPYPVKFQKHGISFIFGKKGGIDFPTTFKRMKPFNVINDIRKCPVHDYDIVINDYEPITAWACYFKGKPCYGLSHQGAYLSQKSPRPARRKWYGEFMLNRFTPLTDLQAFHFERYDDFINTPVIRSGIRQLSPTQQDHIAVYLPAYSDKFLTETLTKVPAIQWKIFSKRAKATTNVKNVEINPVSGAKWEQALASCEGALMGAGFEGPAEALFLGKKLLAIPMVLQYEQECNAASLEKMGVRVVWKVKKNLNEIVSDWLKNDTLVKVDYPDETKHIVNKIISNAK